MKRLWWRFVAWWAARPYAPWWLLNWLNDREYYCWADVVTWKMCGGDWPSRNIKCVTGPHRQVTPELGVTCYCGYWDRVADGSIQRMRENIRCGRPAFEGSEEWPQFSTRAG